MRKLIISSTLTLIAAIFAPQPVQAQEADSKRPEAAMPARHDVHFLTPAERAEDGIPIGNGDLGTMYWTPNDEGGLAFQLNKVDAWTSDNTAWDHQYGLVNLARLVVRPSRPLQADMKEFASHLSLQEAIARTSVQYPQGQCSVRTFISAARPLLVVELEDTRPDAGPVSVAMSLWRIPADGAQTALFHPKQRADNGAEALAGPDDVVVTQSFTTKKHSMRYAVALGAMSGGATYARPEPRSVCVTIKPEKGRKTVVLAAVALSFDPAVDVVAKARQELAAARAAGMEALVQEHTSWWAGFWSRLGTYVYLRSADGLADFLESYWYLCLYQTASSSRGICPPKFNGSIFHADRDYRPWGSNYWVWNTESMNFPLFAQNAIELTEPFSNMYWSHLPAARLDARQLWNCAGAFYTECTTYFQRPIELPPEKIKAEQAKRLETPKLFNATHILSNGSQIAWMFYKRYEYTLDLAWLRDRAYPLMKEAAAFYLDYFKKGPDGKYHIYPTNAHEAFWGVRDGIMDLAACRWLMPRLIRSSETLALDAELRPKWQEFLDNLAPYPTAETPGAQELFPFPAGTYAAGLLGTDPGAHGEAVRCTPVWPFEDIGVGISSPEVLERMRKTLPTEMFGDPDRWVGYPRWSRTPIIGARLGMKELTRKYFRRSAVLGRSFPMIGDIDGECGIVRGEAAQHLSAGVNEALLQSHNGLIQLFQAWPDGWDGRFRLLAQGGVLVESERAGGRIPFVALTPRHDGKAVLVNPWPEGEVQCLQGGKTTAMKGERLELNLKAGQDCLLSPKAAPLAAVPPLVLPPRGGLVQEYYDEPRKARSRIGRDATDRFQSLTPIATAVGPIAPANAAEVKAHFLMIGDWSQFGKNWDGRAPEFVPDYGGAISLAKKDPKGYKTRLCGYVAAEGKDESAYFGDVVMEADFIPDHSGAFGFFFRQAALRSSGHYTATLEPGVLSWLSKPGPRTKDTPKEGRSRIKFTLNEPGYQRVLQYVPLDLEIQDGKTYRLRFTVRSVEGQPLRYADAKLEVFTDAEQTVPAATGEYRLNLSADNMPDAGQAGPCAEHGQDDTDKPWRVLVRNFSAKPCR